MQRLISHAMLSVACLSCGSANKPPTAPPAGAPTAAPHNPPPAPTATLRYDRLARLDFNRAAVRANLPLYWIADSNQNGAIEPAETAALLFYPTSPSYVKAGAFTAEFAAAYEALVALVAAPAPTDPRLALVGRDLDAGRATLVRTDLSGDSPAERAFVHHMLNVATLMDALYDKQTGAQAVATQVTDTLSQSLFRRNRGPKCAAPGTDRDPACTAIAGLTKAPVDVYPAELQKSDDFCKQLEARKDAEALLTPFTAVRTKDNTLVAVPYSEAYAAQMGAIASELEAAASALKDAKEPALIAYLTTAAKAFRDNNWQPADEAWAKMNVDNSKWYVRVAPDEVYWEPCARKAGFHLSFARINQGSRQWQEKLVPVQQEMENAIAAKAGKPYRPHKVAFHLPDFIDIVVNAGDDRDALGATIGQSLPNWGPVANEGRGRTVAMSNLYKDPDSLEARRQQAMSLLDAAAAAKYANATEPGLLSTILHEATHNLGPAHEYKVNGKTDDAAFGGPMASVMEELKAQTGALFYVEFLRSRSIITDDLATATYVDSIVWAFGHISQGMYAGSGAAKTRKTYSNVSAIQIGYLMDQGALVWDASAKAQNGKDQGAFVIKFDKLVPAIDAMMATVGGLKARGDRAGANALAAKYVDGPTVPHAIIAERFLRHPKASFVFAVSE